MCALSLTNDGSSALVFYWPDNIVRGTEYGADEKYGLCNSRVWPFDVVTDARRSWDFLHGECGRGHDKHDWLLETLPRCPYTVHSSPISRTLILRTCLPVFGELFGYSQQPRTNEARFATRYRKTPHVHCTT